MLSMQPFDWRRLTPLSTVEHRLDPSGVLLLRGAYDAVPPFSTVRVRDGKGGFVDKPLESLGFAWSRADDSDGWLLRTVSEPVTMTHTAARWIWPVREASSNTGVDERFLLATIACEVGDAAPDASGLVRAPRTEVGYPQRTGEADRGDPERDAEDWAAYLASRPRTVTHSSHGLMQTLISTAVGVRPDLFQDVDPAHYRDVLAEPASSIACGAAYAATFPGAVRADPLASRFQYGAGSVRAAHNRWGAVLYDELVPLWFIAYWNDLTSVRQSDSPSPRRQAELSQAAAWVFAAFSCFVLALAASYAASQFVRRDT